MRGEPVTISGADLDWVNENLPAFGNLLKVPRFRLAVECFTTHAHEASLRMTTASLWTGVEALFGINAEVRFRSAALVGAFLETRGRERVARYRAVKALYDLRSKAVHGGTLEDQALEQHIRDVRGVLSSLLRKIIESKHLPTDDEWDDVLLG
ncbi:MAG TPA: hypothetical protein VFI25_11090 [Planctomycetota bacterium]|jgi:hypothetical protein|nr:hypothetical protein [Planctomycetota bacterium]